MHSENKSQKDIHISLKDVGYIPESADDFYAQLMSAIGCRPDFQRVYDRMAAVFHHFIDQYTSTTEINLVGSFAKIDYLLKTANANGEMAKLINDTRSRLNKRALLTAEEMECFCMLDFKRLCQFIALVTGTDIPNAATLLFPQDEKNADRKALISQCSRMIVDHWDDQFVYGQIDDGMNYFHNAKVAYTQGNKIYDYDWSYLKDLYYKGAQLNLVRPRLKEEVIYPELIIFEPDFLVDISTVARCFDNFAESDIVNIINRLQPSVTTEPILLGNLSGQLLDECIHQIPSTHTYKDSVRTYFERYPLALSYVNLDSNFHKEAQKQKTNISRAFSELLPHAIAGFDSREGIVEPSFFSEMLGLQGRMDYLQMDMTVVIEQKSGKGGFPYDDFHNPRHREQHYIQLLLYMSLIRYNYRKVYDANNHRLHAFLLYSKYSESLLGLGFAPSLLFRAIKVRNRIAHRDIMCAMPGGWDFLNTITIDDINEKKTDNALWNRFQKTGIEDTLNAIHHATPTERAYCLRFLQFISNEHLLSKIGNKSKENSGFAAIWHDSIGDKLAAGNIYDQLTLTLQDTGDQRVETLLLTFDQAHDSDSSNFRIGDIVVLYPYNKGDEPHATQTIVQRCTITDIQRNCITLRLKSPQTDNRYFARQAGKWWAIEHDFMESSYSSLYKGMFAFLSAPQHRRDLLMMQRQPIVDKTVTLKGNYGSFNDLALRVKQAKELFLIIGPPGTGKTSYGMLNTVKEQLLEPDTYILLLSYTNRAVDEICSKLYAENIDFIRIGGELTCNGCYQNNLLTSRVKDMDNIAQLKEMIRHQRIVVSTTTSLSANIELLQHKHFDLAVVDEASQILEPHIIGILSARYRGMCAIEKMVMIGDYRQLPAVVQQRPEMSTVSEGCLHLIRLYDCRLSLFERLLRQYEHNPQVTYMLTKQGRMHEEIASFPNIAFYGGKLKVVPLPHQTGITNIKTLDNNGIDRMICKHRVVFVGSHANDDVANDKVNQSEAEMIAATVVRIYMMTRNCFDVDATVGVIVPYRNQISAVRMAIDRYGIALLHNISIDTVERFQGSQRDFIIYGFTIQRYYQLQFLTDSEFIDNEGNIVDRKLNVAMTRAREHLIIIGNPELLNRNITFCNMIEHISNRGGYYDIPAEKYISGEF